MNEDKLGSRSLGIRGIKALAILASNRKAIDLIYLCVHQNGAAVPAAKVCCVIAGVENRRRGEEAAACLWCSDKLQTDFIVFGHISLPCSGGSATELSVTDAWRKAAADDGGSVHQE
jgi:hypothetical protein